LKKYIFSVSIALSVGALVSAIVFFAPAFYETFEFKTLDLRFKLRGAIPQSKEIIFLTYLLNL